MPSRRSRGRGPLTRSGRRRGACPLRNKLDGRHGGLPSASRSQLEPLAAGELEITAESVVCRGRRFTARGDAGKRRGYDHHSRACMHGPSLELKNGCSGVGVLLPRHQRKEPPKRRELINIATTGPRRRTAATSRPTFDSRTAFRRSGNWSESHEMNADVRLQAVVYRATPRRGGGLIVSTRRSSRLRRSALPRPHPRSCIAFVCSRPCGALPGC